MSAVCFGCGERKREAFAACARCGREPGADDELAISLFLSSECLDRRLLRGMAKRVRTSGLPDIPPETMAPLREAVREYRRETKAAAKAEAKERKREEKARQEEAGDEGASAPAARQSRWKFW